MVLVCWKPAASAYSHTCPHAENLSAMYGLNLSISRTPVAATATMSISFEKSPERRNDMTRKVTKKIAAVPKSLISASAPRQNIESPINRVRFFLVKSSLSVAAPA